MYGVPIEGGNFKTQVLVFIGMLASSGECLGVAIGGRAMED